jgi:hypothetical protein
MAGVLVGSLRPGRSVRIEGLQKRADINGKQGKIVRLDGERWIGFATHPLCLAVSRALRVVLCVVCARACGGTLGNADRHCARQSKFQAWTR